MSFGGSVAAMIATLKNNKMMLGERYTYFDAKKSYLRATKGMKITYRKATKEELALVRKKIKQQRKQAQIVAVVILSMVIPIVFFGAYKFIVSLNESHKLNEQIITKEHTKKYQFFISDGDLMFQKRKWNNAIFQYTRALEVFPNEFDAQYRLAQAYTYKCQLENEGCFKADSLVDRLITHFPNDENIKKLKTVIRNQLND